jgi:hypothetical protein
VGGETQLPHGMSFPWQAHLFRQNVAPRNPQGNNVTLPTSFTIYMGGLKKPPDK